MAAKKKTSPKRHPLVNHKDPATLSKVFILLGGLIVALMGFKVLADFEKAKSPKTQPMQQTVAPTGVMARYYCADGKTIDADYTDNQVVLNLSDGRQLTLPHAMSADGARYANEDESVVFWNVGNTATLTEGDQTTYSDCTTDS